MSQRSVITQDMRDAIGVDSEPATHVVEIGAIKKFAEAIGDSNPIYSDERAALKTRYAGLIAPPTFLRSLHPAPRGWRSESPTLTCWTAAASGSISAHQCGPATGSR